LLAEAQVGSRLVVVAEVTRQRGLEMARVQNNKVVQTLSANRADESLSIWILPGTLKGCQHFRDAQRLNAQSNIIAVNTVPVADEKTGSLSIGESLDNLLRGPGGRRMTPASNDTPRSRRVSVKLLMLLPRMLSEH
jgi:hypothetical protein